MRYDEAKTDEQFCCRPGSDRLQKDLRPMMLAAAETASAYQYLMGLYPGRHRDQLQKLFEGEMETIACLKGLSLLTGEIPGKMHMPQTREGTTRKLLELSYHRTRKAAEEYGTRVVHPEFGTVFETLQTWARGRCLLIVRILGRM